jgi:hypothetical protein
VRETSVEQRLINRTKWAGGICMKILPILAGYPDRLVLLPGGRLFLIETKAPKGKLRPAQEVFIKRAAKIGIKVEVLYSTSEVDDWAERVSEDPLARLLKDLEQRATLLEDKGLLEIIERYEKGTK